MNTNAIILAANRLHANAVPEGKVKIKGITYRLTFNRYNYDVRLPNGNVFVTFNTRLITTAKKWLREYLAN
jgi:hypothetical protein